MIGTNFLRGTLFSRWQKLLVIGVTITALGGCGGGGGGATPTPTAPPPVSMAAIALFAGNLGGPGNINGIGVLARLHTPQGVATDSAGNLYVADTDNQIIRKITPAGLVSTLAGQPGVSGRSDGSGAAASFYYPNSIATDGPGNVYVTDITAVRKITPGGMVSTLAVGFSSAAGIATDSVGNVYVADTGNQTIRKITPAGLVSTLAGTPGANGSANGSAAAARFFFPKGIATDSTGNVYVADTGNQTIRKITPAGLVSTLAGQPSVSGRSDGIGSEATFFLPSGITTDSAGNVYVADTGNQTIRKITLDGLVSTLVGTPRVTGSSDGRGSAASFNSPQGIAADSAGNVYVADAFNQTIRKISVDGLVSTLVGAAGITGSADGRGATAGFSSPSGITTDSLGNVYVADTGNQTIRKITVDALVSTVAGMTGVSGNVDGGGADARFNSPLGIAADSAGNIYVADTFNRTIRKITSTGLVSTLAGTGGVFGRADGSGAAARFLSPRGIAADRAGNLYVADADDRTIRKVTPTGLVSTLAGMPGVRGNSDGAGAAARFTAPEDIATDNAGNLYVVDKDSHTIRKVTPDGLVSTLAGTPGVSGSADGTGAAASFNLPQYQPGGIATDSAGNVYVSDTGNRTIRKITPNGLVITLAGQLGRDGFSAGALPGGLYRPTGLAISGSLLYVTMSNGIAVIANLP
ncbi:MAG: hypothetical protein KA045_01480 [Burkholderiaceae bacterium]|nr:hypothetical protein [Burkholderiaceae bacterium]